MLHQIRKMVATAVAVARGALPSAFIPAAMCRPCRARTPMAPPATLVLAGATFRPFKPDTSRGVDAAAQAERIERGLTTSDAVQAEVDAWADSVLLPALAPALTDDTWEEFLRNLAPMCPPQEGLAPVLAAAAAYREAERPPREERPPRGSGGGGAAQEE
jgi:tRNA pseudouridine38-40 synthase